MISFDAIVIGGSYAGLSAAMQLARARRRVCVVDTGAPRNRFAPAAHGFFAHDGEAPLAMIEQAREKLLAYPTVTLLQGKATSAIARNGSDDSNGSDGSNGSADTATGFEIEIEDGTRLAARKLVLAFGVHDLLPAIAGLSERWGTTVLHCPYCHGYEFAGQRMGVLYHAPASVQHAQLVAEWGPTTLFLNGDTSLAAADRDRLEAADIAIEPAQITALEGPGTVLHGVRLQDGTTPHGRVVPLDALYLAACTRPASPLAEQLGCAMEDAPMGPCVRTDETNMTSVPGVYAAGDLSLSRHNATLACAAGVVAGTCLHQALVFKS